MRTHISAHLAKTQALEIFEAVDVADDMAVADEKPIYSFTDAVEVLRRWRDDNVRQSAAVVAIWDDFLATVAHTGAMQDEKWMILEQVSRIG